MKEIQYFIDKIRRIFLQVSPASLLDVFTGNFQKGLVDELGMIRNQMRVQNRSEMVEV
jgi:hypothetical protein